MTPDVRDDHTPRRWWSRGVLTGALLMAVAAALIGVGRASARVHVSDSRYVGAEHCRGCHPEAYAMWRASAHARAFEALDDRQRQDPRCLQCHTTEPDDNDPEVAGVQCEACHGPGRYYSPSYVMRDAELRGLLGYKTPGEESCGRCHTESTPSIEPFSFAEKFELIRHDATASNP